MIFVQGKSLSGIPCLIPTDAESEEALRKTIGKVVVVKAQKARSPEQHRMFFAVMRVVFDNQEQFKTLNDLKEATLIELGYSELRETFNGERYRVAQSIAFHKMKHDDFTKLFDAALNLWSRHFNIPVATLLQEGQSTNAHQ